MSVEYNFLLTSRGNPKMPHLLVLIQNERTGKFSWSYNKIQGSFVPKGQKPEASGDDVRYGMGGGEFDLYANGSRYGTLTLNNNKSIRTLITGDTGVFVSFSGSIDDARFTK